MRLIYFDIDTLRADHLGCYGYHRPTSPNIDKVAEDGIRFEKVYASDVPCLPSRMALSTGRFGIHNGAINHGGARAEPFNEGESRKFRSLHAQSGFVAKMRESRMYTASVSTFAERHAAYHALTGYNENINIGTGGLESAHRVSKRTIDWLTRNRDRESWFLHVHMWDPHTPYRVPEEFGDPFAKSPCPEWLSDEVRKEHWDLPGPHSAQEAMGYSDDLPWAKMFSARQPFHMGDMNQVRKMFDGYDTGVLYADHHIGLILQTLKDLNLDEDTAIMISSDHGETLGELGIYGDHHTADEFTSHVPMILKWPGLAHGRGRTESALHYQIDVAATVLELLGLEVPEVWDGESFANALSQDKDEGRDYLVLSQAAWAAQRSVRFDDYIATRTYHDAYHGFPDLMLYDLKADPHQQVNLADRDGATMTRALALLESWHAEQMARSTSGVDPLTTVMAEGGPFHVRDQLPNYLKRLRATGRENWADRLEKRYLSESTKPLWRGNYDEL